MGASEGTSKKKLLVGADGSQYEQEVVDAAVAIAKGLGAEVHLVRGIHITAHGVPYGMLSMSPAEVEAEMLKGAERDLEMLMLRVPAAQRGTTRAVIAVPVVAVEEAAKELDVDAIVIGARGHGLIDRLVGSTAAKIVNHADRTVIVIRAPQRLVSAG